MYSRDAISVRARQLRKSLKAVTVSCVYTLTKYCMTCNHLHSDNPNISKVDVTTSASLGCRYCTFFLNALNHFPVSDNYGIRWSRRSCRLEHARQELQLYTPVGTYGLSLSVKKELARNDSGYPPAFLGISQNNNPLDAGLNSSPQTPEAFEFIRSCLGDCDASHPECKAAGQELPTRLLNVQHEGAQQVVLVETKSLPLGHMTAYIALSYCWGKSQNVTLRSENLELMKLGFMVSGLPQTLQDAIAVTRALGQQYLWVDALCIIQDSPSDWEVESSRMASVYRNAYLTIAVATVSDVSEGFLSRNYRATNPWYREPYHEDWLNRDGCSTMLGARLVEATEFFNDKGDFAHKLPWILRGWVLQEQELSRRPLIYEAYELHWVCQNKNTYQCSSDQVLSSGYSVDLLDGPPIFSITASTAHKQWHHIVVHYTARELTDSRDKLPAISGLAKIFQEVIQSPYFAGMWVKHLLWDLLWDCVGRNVGYASEQYIAPSFSWASASSDVVFGLDLMSPTDEWVPRAVIEDIGSIIDGKDPLGRLSNGWIKLRGFTFKAALADNPDGPQEHGFQRYSVWTEYLGESHFQEDTWLEGFKATNEHGNLEISVRRLRRPSSITPQDIERPPPIIQCRPVVYLFLVGYEKSVSTEGPGHRITSCCFLVLGLASDKTGRYERLGYFRYNSWERSQREQDDWISGLLSAADGHKLITIV